MQRELTLDKWSSRQLPDRDDMLALTIRDFLNGMHEFT
jgi:hypothetical protein